MKSRFFSILAAASLFTALVGLAFSQDEDRVQIYKPLPSTALVLADTIQGSGFLVDRADRLLVTSCHVAKADQDVEVIFPVTAGDGQILTNREFYLRKAKRIKGKCIATTSERDLAILQVQSVPDSMVEIKFAGKSPKAGDQAHMVGNPTNNAQMWVHGYSKVQAVKKVELYVGANQRVEATTVVLTPQDRKIGPGASGGPVVNDDGDLIGVIQSGPVDGSYVNSIEVGEVRVYLGQYFRKLATAALSKKEYNEAIARCTRSLEINPSDALTHNERGVAYAFQQRFDEAIEDYSKALKIDPKLARAYRNRATAYYFQENFRQALEDCSAAIKIDPQYAQAYLSRSKAYQKLGLYAESTMDYDKAVALDPSIK